MGIALSLHIFHHAGDPPLHIGFSLPEIELHIQTVIVFPQILHGYLNNMIPERTVSPHTILQLKSRLHGFFLVGSVLLRLSAGHRVDLLQLRDRKGRLLRILSVKLLIKIGKFRLSQGQFIDDQPHLQPPVSQVNVADHFRSRVAADPLNTLSDDSGTQMPHMERLRHVRSAVIYDNFLSLPRFAHPKFRGLSHFFQIVRQKLLFHLQI